MQSPERTVAEIHHIHDKYGFEAFMIYDDLFIASKNRMAGILELLKRPFTFRCFARSNLVEEGICQLLTDLGVVEVGLGIETGSDAILKKNMKGATVEQNSRAVALLRKYGIRAKSFIIVGLPGETYETVEETADWLRKTRPDDVDVSVFQPYPGSPIFENPEEWGITFQYDGKPQWFKGTPGKYESSVSTESLSAQEIVKYRDMLEAEFKPKELLR